IGTSVPVTITGTNLTGATLNQLAGITATVGTVTDTQITASLNIAATAALGTRSIIVTTAGGASNAMTFTINPPTPGLTTIAPSAGVTGTSVPVTLTGTNLAGATLSPVAGITVTMGTVTATQITASFAIAANAAPGSQNITVTTAGGTSNAVPFTIKPPIPTLTGIAPLTGVIGTSVTVTLAGTNLTGATLNLPSGITTTGGIISATQIIATLNITTAAALGPQSITVSTAGGTSNAASFLVIPLAPTLASITPAKGAIGTSVAVTLTGTGLAGATLVLPAGITATVGVNTDTQVTATLAIGSTATLGPQNITISNANGTSNAISFAVIPGGLVAGYWLAGLPAGSTAVPNVVSGGPALTLFNNPTIGAAGIGLNAGLHQYGTIAGVTLPVTMTVITVSDTTNKSTFVEQGPNTNTSDGFWLYGLGVSSFSVRRGTAQRGGPSDPNWEGIGPVMLGTTFDGANGVNYRNGAAFHSFAVAPIAGSATDTVYVGSRAGTSLFMNGNMRFVGIWNRALSAAEITAVYQSLKTEFGTVGVALP
ncbi:MAG TPA: LamG-like jellyroll fold domain-containing protein, partial [Candidatus Solibacter sp.]|nr:LamG-like jellyroll fold domain-containing protein [Candidatus Solibacter sp.]